MKTKLLIFGITGDLSTKKLLPAIEQIINTDESSDLAIIGVSRNQISVEDVLANCENKSLFDNKLSTFTMDMEEPGGYQSLNEHIGLNDDEQLLIYLAVPPVAIAQIIERLGNAGLNAHNIKILFEKPFGTDLVSAININDQTTQYYHEEQIYRIDHYLAKEMAQNLVTIRSKNALFSQIWQNNLISSITIVASETIDIEGRANFYEQTGALRDVVQGHLMQLLSLVLMDAPEGFHWDELPKRRMDAISKLNPASPFNVVRAQYDGYRAEVSKPDSMVETFVSIGLESTDPKWSDVPIKLIAGKALDKKTTEIRVHIKKTDASQSDCLLFNINPDEGVGFELLIKKPGYSNELEMHRFGFDYPDGSELPDPYEQVLVDAISSRKSLFTSSEEVLASWRILQPVLDSWSAGDQPLKIYPKGSSVNSIISVE